MSQQHHIKQQRKESKRKGKEDNEALSRRCSEITQEISQCKVAEVMYTRGLLTEEQRETYQDRVAQLGKYLLNCLKANKRKSLLDELSSIPIISDTNNNRVSARRTLVTEKTASLDEETFEELQNHLHKVDTKTSDSDSSSSSPDPAHSTGESSPYSSSESPSSSDSESRSEQKQPYKPGIDQGISDLQPTVQSFSELKSPKTSDVSDGEQLLVSVQPVDSQSHGHSVQMREQPIIDTRQVVMETGSESDGYDLTRGPVRRKIKHSVPAVDPDGEREELKQVTAKIMRRYRRYEDVL